MKKITEKQLQDCANRLRVLLQKTEGDEVACWIHITDFDSGEVIGSFLSGDVSNSKEKEYRASAERIATCLAEQAQETSVACMSGDVTHDYTSRLPRARMATRDGRRYVIAVAGLSEYGNEKMVQALACAMRFFVLLPGDDDAGALLSQEVLKMAGSGKGEVFQFSV